MRFKKNKFLSKKKKKNTSKKILKKKIRYFLHNFKKKKKLYISITVVVLITLIIYITLQQTIFSEKYDIQEINYSKESVEKYDNPYLYKEIKEKIKDKNFYIFTFFQKNKFLKKLQKKYPILKDIQLHFKNTQRVVVTTNFCQPNLVFFNWENLKWSLKENFVELSSWSLLLSGKQEIYLPDYTKKIKNRSWFFYKISENKLSNQIKQIKNFFWESIDKIHYLPGWSKTIVSTKKGKKIYINNLKNIIKQFQKYSILKEKYKNFQNLEKIDLWSNKSIIIKKQ